MADIQLNSVTLATESGGVVTVDSAAAGTGGLRSQQVFTTVGAVTWTRPSGITTIEIYCTGGGGGGGGSSSNWNNGGGGGAGATAIGIVDVTSIPTLALVVGNFGAAGGTAAGGSDGTDSTVTISGGAQICKGGFGERGSAPWSADPKPGTVGKGGTATVTTGSNFLLLAGGDGGAGGGGDILDESSSGAIGGSSYWGGGGQQGASTSVIDAAHYGGKAARCYGAGGGGGDDDNGTSFAGGAGMSGIILIKEYS